MSSTRQVLPLVRGSLALVIALLGAALLLTAWTSYVSVRKASSTLLRGQANALQHSLRSHLLELDAPLDEAALLRILRAESYTGLRFIAAVDRGRALLRVGEPVAPLQGLRAGALAEEPVLVEDRVRLAFRARTSHAGAEGRRPRALLMVLEFEPVQAAALRAAAARTFAISAVAGGVLLVVAALLLRWMLRREALERQLERERRLAGLGEMSAVLAHEIRNPLASLKGNAQLLAEALGDLEKHGAKARRVVDEAVRLESLTNDLLEYVRTGELHRREVSPAALLREAAAAVDAQAISVEASDSGAPWPLDPERIRQVLVNLLENAVAAGAPVRASLQEAGAQLRFVIQDSGPGVPPGERERIFEPFHTTRTRGTGLGLAVARRVVEQHGGSISVENGAAGGAVFCVVLPRS
jgi:two-component system, NtrC family, sensor histidine kinase HydH